MRAIKLPGSGRSTSQLGFGCSSIMGALNRHDSLRALEWAFEAGLRHFDVAPMYGFGEAESCLGEFVQRHAGMVTVTTKFGIPPEPRNRLKQMVRTLARPMLKAMPALKKQAQAAAGAITATPSPRNLDAEAARKSLEASLRALRVECIDVFLLHDATLEEVRENNEVLSMLEQSKAEGKIAVYGVGTERDHAEAILHQAPAFAHVIQHEWSVFDPVSRDHAFHITHRALATNRVRLQAYLASAPAVAQAWSSAVGADLSRPADLSGLMMRAALWANSSNVVLFSSKSEAHIHANAQLANHSTDDPQAERLYRLVQREFCATPAPDGTA